MLVLDPVVIILSDCTAADRSQCSFSSVGPRCDHILDGSVTSRWQFSDGKVVPGRWRRAGAHRYAETCASGIGTANRDTKHVGSATAVGRVWMVWVKENPIEHSQPGEVTRPNTEECDRDDVVVRLFDSNTVRAASSSNKQRLWWKHESFPRLSR